MDKSLAQLFVSSNFSVLTTFVYSCHTSLTVMPLSVYICVDVITVSGSAISDACLMYYCELWLDCVTMKSFWSAHHFPVQWLQLCLLSSECTIECECTCLCLPSFV